MNINGLIIEECYNYIVQSESKIIKKDFNSIRLSALEIANIANQLEEIATSATVPRCSATRYGPLEEEDIIPESVSAHTELFSALVDRVLAYIYGPYMGKTEDGFTYREIMETIRRHDLPENLIGDLPDNGSRDESDKNRIEKLYLHAFSAGAPCYEEEFEIKVLDLHERMNRKIGFTGQLLYAADKVSAIMSALAYCNQNNSAYVSSKYEGLSKNEAHAMSICDIKHKDPESPGHFICFAYEMWTIDYFKQRKLYKYDSTGLITALLIMFTVITKGTWYDWREKDYE